MTTLQVLICTIEIITQPNGYIFNCCLTFTMMNKLTSWSHLLLFVETFLHTLDPQILSFIRLHVHTSYLLRLTENKYRFLVFPPFSLSSHVHIHTHTHTCNCNFSSCRLEVTPTWQSHDACTLSRHCERCKQSSWSWARNSPENRPFLTTSGMGTRKSQFLLGL